MLQAATTSSVARPKTVLFFPVCVLKTDCESDERRMCQLSLVGADNGDSDESRKPEVVAARSWCFL